MTSTYSIPERLISKISEVAKKEGFAKPEDFLTRLIEQKLLDLEVREKVLAITEKSTPRMKPKASVRRKPWSISRRLEIVFIKKKSKESRRETYT